MRNQAEQAAKTPYSKKAILKRVNSIKVTKERGYIVTRDGNRLISKWKPSKIYEKINFADAVSMLLNVIGILFTPENYTLTIKNGYQELKIQGKSHIINGETFHEMIWLTNSTDGTKQLAVRFGLMRQICSNGAVMTYKGTSFKMKHLTSNNVNEELQSFMKSLPKLDVTRQITELKKISQKEISVRELSNYLVNGIGKKGNDTIWNDLVRKLTSSKTDSLGTKQDALIKGINVPFNKMAKKTLDSKIPSWTVFNCYTELWRSLDASEIERETNKIMKVLN